MHFIAVVPRAGAEHMTESDSGDASNSPARLGAHENIDQFLELVRSTVDRTHTTIERATSLRLALDNHGNVTLAGHAIVDSQGNAILTDQSGKPFTADSAKITADSLLTVDGGRPIRLPGGQPIQIGPPKP
jgi:hypothetical protein